ncbi:MAG: LacI family DNA-binding transcriptional regulator [Phycisphaerales bacterium]|nr:LacI family DNA-binding transcriptional regulator [Phycisphaerales bacterium]
MPVSIADVAKLANVSISTVSRVVNRRAVVNAETRARVESAIRQLGYQPNPFARGLMLRRSDVVGLILPDIHGEFYSEIIRGADAEARRRGLNLMVSSARDAQDSHSLLSAIQQRMLLDGVAVMVAEINIDIERELEKSSIPICVIDENLEGDGLDSVAIDQEFGAAAPCANISSNTEACGESSFSAAMKPTSTPSPDSTPAAKS